MDDGRERGHVVGGILFRPRQTRSRERAVLMNNARFDGDLEFDGVGVSVHKGSTANVVYIPKERFEKYIRGIIRDEVSSG